MIDNTKKSLLSILLSTVLTSSIIYPYTNDIVPITIAIFFMCIIIFNIYIAISRKLPHVDKIYALILFAILIIFIKLALTESNGTSFIEWIFNAYSYNSDFLLYLILLIVLFTIFITSIIYYFTELYYKPYIIFFIMLIPGVLYFKLSMILSGAYPALLIIFLIAIISHYNHHIFINDGTPIYNKAYIRAFAVLLLATMILASIIPRYTITPYSAKLEEIINYNNYNLASMQSMTTLTSRSTPRGSNNPNSRKHLFTVTADEPLYLRKGVFTDFDGTRWHLNSNEDLSFGYSNWVNNSYIKYRAPGLLYQSIYNICKDYPYILDEFSLTLSDIPQNIPTASKTASIFYDDFYTNYILNTAYITSADGIDDLGYRNSFGEIFYTYGILEKGTRYNIDYYQDILPYQGSVQDFTRKLSLEEYKLLLRTIYYLSPVNSEELTILNTAISDLQEAEILNNYTTHYTSSQIDNLAKSITADLDNDYDKALALQNYFYNNGYTYDLSYSPPKDQNTIEYFIFNSKTGVCADYATAMVLMCQSVGLTARYIEGFHTGGTVDANGNYIVTPMNSHAFVEVFIPGYGWSTFEPTISASINSAPAVTETAVEEVIQNSIYLTGVKKAAIILALIILLFSIIYRLTEIILIPLFIETTFRIRLKYSDYDKQICLIYNHLGYICSHRFQTCINTFTPEETKDLIYNITGIDISPIIKAYEYTAFGENHIEDIQPFMDIYLQLYHYKK